MSMKKFHPTLTLTAAAKALGVTREHLSRVLHGHRQSRRLLQRYAAIAQHQPSRKNS